MTSIHLTNFRLILALATVAVLVFHITCLFASPFVKEIDGKKPTENVPANGIVRHKKGDAFYSNWLATTISEWVLAFLILLQVLTFCYDFAMVKIPSLKDFHANRTKHEQADWCDEPSEEQARIHQIVPTDAYYGTPSRRVLYRVDQTQLYMEDEKLAHLWPLTHSKKCSKAGFDVEHVKYFCSFGINVGLHF
ncbi:hypothetical protein ANCCAN_23244 [Ancylostoma caninum]|uniref:Uncharacterized protein n=1 Tax=Ancylostoma caninum TaxID=29170 RepID=A0A368FJE5_ANCCA|nr:hypothetical protein ANCCAN_23244 [Ancylostoma caninum]